ncbi:mediator of RNA polymerase II transcription subunit 1 [Erpetoichthys calabaricus]|uniref:mediator of RNA polymerase II transcription subunit 1 n=1 Tax=Erpetoichthys calabaricus TaxID=27687 RepID=UPI002234647C|nr:mediator of RNA polymerase II transcription subunit 1 [Erpetoichthys calabaricus]
MYQSESTAKLKRKGLNVGSCGAMKASEIETSVQTRMLMERLRSKFSEKSWNETLYIVHRCLEKPIGMLGSSVNQLFLNCVASLQKSLNVTSFTGMVTRLDAISKLTGLGSHLSPNDTAYYITSDMFYLEIILKSSGEVLDVRVAHHGEAPVVSKELTELLR